MCRRNSCLYRPQSLYLGGGGEEKPMVGAYATFVSQSA